MNGKKVKNKKVRREEYSYSCMICDKIGRVDKELSEAAIEDRRKYDSRTNAR